MSGMLAPEDENDAEVRREDQIHINTFARLNARLHELRSDRESLKKQLEGLDDASTELMMGGGGASAGGDDDGDGNDTAAHNSNNKPILLVLGEAFLECTEDEATEACEQETEALQEQVGKLKEEEDTILQEQAKLKQMLYARFGKSINLEA